MKNSKGKAMDTAKLPKAIKDTAIDGASLGDAGGGYCGGWSPQGAYCGNYGYSNCGYNYNYNPNYNYNYNYQPFNYNYANYNYANYNYANYGYGYDYDC